jgi:hypothetical protein
VKRRSAKAAARYEVIDELRANLRLTIDGCDYCETPNFALHEIVRCNLRSYVAGLPAVILALCDPGCHQEVACWKPVRQLALLKYRRPERFDLDIYNRWSTAKVTEEDVDAAMCELISEMAHE